MLNKFHLTGLTCAACKKLSEKRIFAIAGVTNTVVNLDQKIVEITSDRQIKLDEVNNALQGTPYEAKD